MTELLERLVWLTDPRDEEGKPHWLIWFPFHRFQQWRQRRRESAAAGFLLVAVVLVILHPIESVQIFRHRNEWSA